MERPKTAHSSEDTSRKVDENSNEFTETRPASRRGARTAQRESSVRTERTLSRGLSTGSQENHWRPGSGVARIQGTASRLLSAATQARGSAVAINTPRLDTFQVNVTDRLLTQQGLSSSRARSGTAGLRGPGKRQVLDKRYYEGILQLKIQELTNEIALLRKETELSNKEKEDYMVYEKQNKDRAKELSDLQGVLGDYNLVMDKLHTGTEVRDIENECQTLKISNDAEQAKLEQVFKERTQKQQQIHQLDEEIKKDRHVAEKLMDTMPPEMKEKYSELSNQNTALHKTIDAIQLELDTITKEKASLEQQIINQPLKQEALKRELKLLELEEKREHLTSEDNDNDPSNLHQKYLNQVKEDNIEIATMERSMNQLNDELKNYETQLEQVEQDLEECQSERHKKYLDLRKREETIESFLSTYEETREKEKENAAKLKKEIVQTLTAISEHLVTLPATESDYELVDKELSQIDVSDSNDQKSLYVQFKQKQLYLEKLQTLEAKLQSEVGTLYDKIEKIQSEIEIYENLDALKDEADHKRNELMKKKQLYMEVQGTIKDELKTVKHKYEEIHRELQANETHKQLQALERKLIQIEQDNFALREFIADKKCEMNYESNKKQALELVRVYNNDLKDKYKAGM